MPVIQKRMIQIVALFTTLLFSLFTVAQEVSTEMQTDQNKGLERSWYTSPWVWIIGAVIFVLLLIALLRGSERRG